ncbi:type IV secretion system protein VirB10 [Acinetobacter pittii]|uniref:type IV secretion system protein VirB10 n=1 Tax=Acinetobacter pittii TaxID=48296 RepID=UPI0032608444
MNKNVKHQANDDDEKDIITAGQEEQDFDFNQALATSGGNTRNIGIESVQEYDGRSAVGQRKKFGGSGNKTLVWLLIIFSIVVGGWMIYKASNFDFSSGKASAETVEEEQAENKDFRTETGDRQFSEDFKRRQAEQEKLDAIAQSEAQGDQPIEAEHIELNEAGENNPQPTQPIIQDNGSNLNAGGTGGEPVVKLTPEQERMNRMLSSGFNNESGGTGSAGGGFGNSAGGRGSLAGDDEERERKPSGLESSMAVTSFSGATAGKMRNRDLTIDKGTFIDCVMTTKFNSQLAGLMTCEVTRNIYSASGRVVLIDRGSKVTGQYQGGIQQGQTRVFVMWDRIVTPKGVAIDINSPASSELGESGLTGRINNHFWKRFGGAMLVSLIDGVGEGLGKSLGASVGRKLDKSLGNESGTTVIDLGGSSGSSSSTDVASKIIEQTINIPPTIVKHQGDKITVFVSRDLDFSKVYRLR